ncbi:MAG: GTPase, partial [Pirellulaceae bacterium]
AEAVLGVIDAANQRELDVALSQLAGGLATPLHHLREELLGLLAHLEAGLDFVEEDIEFISAETLDQQLADISREIQNTLLQIQGRHAPDTQIRIVLRGSANVGKSSLLNALTGASTSLVSEQQGTTRDYVTHHCKINSLSCLLVDTAGVTPVTEQDRVGQDAQELGNEQARQATLELFCIDSTRPLNQWERQQ